MKYSRLLAGLIVLFSIFLFMGTEGEHGCTQCETESLGGSLTILNASSYMLTIYVVPKGTDAVLPRFDQVTVYLDEGLYQVIAIRTVIMYGEEYLLTPDVIGVRMVEIKLGSNKTIIFN